MDKIFYKQLIEDSPSGYAYHRIICDDAGIPCDYEFIEVNPAFKILTGLNNLDIAGRKITDILPDIRKDEFDWISFYGDIAINGGKKEFEQFSDSLKRWYRVNVYSPQKYYFITHFNDITKEIQNIEEKTTLVTTLNDIVFELDEEYNFLKVFASDEKLLFLPRDKIIGSSIKDFFSVELAELFINSLEKASISIKKVSAAYKSPIPGDERWFNADFMHKEDNFHKGYIVSISDITDFTKNEEEKKRIEASLKERVKEIGCLYAISTIIEAPGASLNEIFSKIVGVLPTGWKHPEIACARISINGSDYKTYNYRKTKIKQEADINIFGKRAGFVEVLYPLERDVSGKDMFLKQENALLKAIAERLGRTAERMLITEELLESKSRYSQLSEQSRIFAWEVDENGLYTFVDHVSEIVLGYRPEEIIGRKYFYELSPEEDREAMRQGAFDVFGRKEKFVNLENRVQAKDGHMLWVSTNGIPILKDDGTLLGYRGSDTDITERKRALEELHASEEKFRVYTEKAPLAIFIVDNMGRYTDANSVALEMTGYSKEELLNLSIPDFIAPEFLEDGLSNFNEVKSNGFSQGEFIARRKGGKRFWMHLVAAKIDNNRSIAFCSDITERKKTEEAIFIEKERSHMTLSSIGDGVISTDKKGNVMTINKTAEELTGWKQEESIGRHWEEIFNIIDEFTQERCANPNLNITDKATAVNYGSNIILVSKEGIKRPIENSVAPIMNSENKLMGLVLVFRDISDKKRKQEEIIYLSYHDSLTGLYNRRFYEEELKRLDTKRNLPITLVMADLNGLKLINDSFGHVMGDELIKKVADVLRKGFRADDIIARLGGDEFVILLPKTDVFEAARIIKRVKSIALKEKVGDFDVSISIGYATMSKEDENIQELFNNAEDHMYRDKLDKSLVMKRNTIDLIMNTIGEKNERERHHSENVSEICGLIAESMDFDIGKVSQIRNAGFMHDIGKIAIDEKILEKALIYNDEDWKEIKRHSEIGYRILSSVSEFSEIAEFVLEHHERWDGKGYPKGLKGEEISIQARIIAVADPFDAMTGASTYREPLSEEEAVAEIIKGAGTQFDPEVARVFIEKVLKKGTVLF